MSSQLSSDDLEELKALRQVFDYSASLKRLEDYGKWVFTAVASITALGAGFSNSAFKTLTRPGKTIFALALILAGASLSSAALLLSPQWQTVNRWSRDSMRAALAVQFRHRHIYTVAAGLLLSLALVLAGIAPAVSAFLSGQPTTPKLSYAYSKGTFEITLSLAGVAPDSDATLSVVRVENQDPEVPVAKVLLHSDQSGAGTRTFQFSGAPGTYRLTYSCRTADGKEYVSHPEEVTVNGVADKSNASAGSAPQAPASGPKAKQVQEDKANGKKK
jgi:hypothetical protein